MDEYLKQMNFNKTSPSSYNLTKDWAKQSKGTFFKAAKVSIT